MCVCLYVYKHLPCILHAGLTACVSHFERQGITHASEARLRPLVRGGRAGRGRGDVLGRGGGGGGNLITLFKNRRAKLRKRSLAHLFLNGVVFNT